MLAMSSGMLPGLYPRYSPFSTFRMLSQSSTSRLVTGFPFDHVNLRFKVTVTVFPPFE